MKKNTRLKTIAGVALAAILTLTVMPAFYEY